MLTLLKLRLLTALWLENIWGSNITNTVKARGMLLLNSKIQALCSIQTHTWHVWAENTNSSHPLNKHILPFASVTWSLLKLQPCASNKEKVSSGLCQVCQSFTTNQLVFLYRGNNQIKGIIMSYTWLESQQQNDRTWHYRTQLEDFPTIGQVQSR